MSKPADPDWLFERDWFVHACTLTPLEPAQPCDNVERYRWTNKEKSEFQVIYKFRPGADHEAEPQTMFQDGYVFDEELKSEWRVRPRFFGGALGIPGLWLPYIVLDCPSEAEPNGFFVVGYPDRSLLWIMSTRRKIGEPEYKLIVDRCENEWGYDRSEILDKLHRPEHEESGFIPLEEEK